MRSLAIIYFSITFLTRAPALQLLLSAFCLSDYANSSTWMLIAFPDEAITPFQSAREGWTVHEGFDPGCSLAWDANAGAKDSESLWLLHKNRRQWSTALKDGRRMKFLQDWFLCPEATIHIDLGHCTSSTPLLRDSPTLPLPEPTTFPYTECLQLFYLLFYFTVFSGIRVVVATKRFWLYGPVLQTLGFKGVKGPLMLPFPLAGPQEGSTWACSRPKVTQTQVLAGAEQASPCVGLSVHSAAHKLWLWKPGLPLQNTKTPQKGHCFQAK